jgi:hypothetical protein
MPIVSVHKYRVYDAYEDRIIVAERMATLDFIKMVRGKVIRGSHREIDSLLLSDNGQAPPDFQPIGD